MSKSPESLVNLDKGVVGVLTQKLAVARTLRLIDKKKALNDLTVEVGSIRDLPENLEFDPQSLKGLLFARQHSILNWELNVLINWLAGNQHAAFGSKKIADDLAAQH